MGQRMMRNDRDEFLSYYCKHRKHKFLPRYKLIKIIKGVNEKAVERILKGLPFELPCNLGSIVLEKFDSTPFFKNDKLKVMHAVNWNETKRLWAEDENAKKNKTLIRYTNKWVYVTRFIFDVRAIRNVRIFDFRPTVDFKHKIHKAILNGTVLAGERKFIFNFDK